MTTLAERFEKLAALRPDISKGDIARACGVKPPSVTGWFSGGSKNLKAETAIKAANLYGVSLEWLTSGKGEMRVTQSGAIPLDYEPNQPLSSESIAPGATNEVATIGQTLGHLNALLVGVDAGTRETIANLTQEAICKPDKAQANIAAIEALVRFATGKIETAALRSATHS